MLNYVGVPKSTYSYVDLGTPTLVLVICLFIVSPMKDRQITFFMFIKYLDGKIL